MAIVGILIFAAIFMWALPKMIVSIEEECRTERGRREAKRQAKAERKTNVWMGR